jgi:hypothetical protein
VQACPYLPVSAGPEHCVRTAGLSTNELDADLTAAPALLQAGATPAALRQLEQLGDGRQLASASLEHDPDQLGSVTLTTAGVGLERSALTTMDRTRRAARLNFHGAPDQILATGEPARAARRTARHIAQIARACEQVGGATRCVHMSLDHAKNRHQVGVPIGTCQAVQRRCADMLVGIEVARSAAEYSAWCVDTRPEEIPTAALKAGSFFKRAESSGLTYGQPVVQRAQLGALVGL